MFNTIDEYTLYMNCVLTFKLERKQYIQYYNDGTMIHWNRNCGLSLDTIDMAAWLCLYGMHETSFFKLGSVDGFTVY